MNEQEPQLPAPNAVYVDVLKELKYGDFFDALSQAEAQMDLYNDAKSRAGHIEVLTELFGLEYESGVCRVLGESYQMKEDGYLSSESNFFHREDVVYGGITIEVIDDEERVLISYWDPEADVEFFVLPESLLQLEIHETVAQEGIRDILLRHVDDAKRLISSGAFLAASYDDQQEKLDTLFTYIESDLNTYSNDGRVEFDCDDYYLIPDAGVTVSLADAHMDQSGRNGTKHFFPSGVVVSASILEQLDGHEFENFFEDAPMSYQQVDDFPRSGGVPCVVLRDDLIRVTYLIQLDSIRDAICIEATDAGQDEEGS
ncbi:hypothetical protein D3C85_158480 [compost metagenome]